MSYGAFETSTESAMPIRLYRFVLSNRTWRYNSSDKDVMSVDGSVWLAAAIEDDGSRQSGESESDVLTIKAQSNIAPVQIYKLSPPSSPIQVTVFEKHIGDDELYVHYVGEVVQVQDSASVGSATISCETISATMKREGLRMVWQRSCPHTVYDSGCKLSPVSHMVTVTIQSVSETTLVMSGMPTGQGFSGGFLEWDHPVKGVERMAIEAQNGNQVFPFGTTVAFHVGMTIRAYRGCNQTPAACQSFGNYANYGGVPTLPGKSPFDGLSSPFF